MANINVVAGDIARVKADALITAINSGGMWAGGIDGVIFRCAGDIFHKQVAMKLPLKHGQAVVAKGNSTNRGAFENVVFVIDDLAGPLGDIVFNALMAADQAGFKSVTLPAIRMGVMRGVVEKTLNEAVQQIANGIQRFDMKNDFKPKLQEITFVIYGDDETVRELQAAFQVSKK